MDEFSRLKNTGSCLRFYWSQDEVTSDLSEWASTLLFHWQAAGGHIYSLCSHYIYSHIQNIVGMSQLCTIIDNFFYFSIKQSKYWTSDFKTRITD